MGKVHRRHAWVGVLLALFMSAPAPAGPILVDQQAIAPSGTITLSWREVDTDWDEAQTITVGLAGELNRIDVELRRGANATLGVMFDLRQVTAAGAPVNADSPVLASLVIPPAAVPVYPVSFPYTATLVALDLSGFDINVSPGQRLALTMRSDEPPHPASSGRGYLWRTSGQNQGTYTGGAAFTRQDGAWFEAGPVQDFSFRTWVEVPEPGTGAGLAGMMVLCSLRRRRPRRRRRRR